MKKILTMMVVLVVIAGSAFASLVINHELELTSSNDNGTRNMGTSISASVGDVIAFTAALNGNATYTYNAVSGDGGAVGSLIQTATDGTKSIHVAYYNVTTAGTFDLTVGTVGTKFATLGAYVIGTTDSDTVSLLSADHTFVTPGITTNTVDYGSFASSSGIVLEAASIADTFNVPAGRAGTINGGNNRGVFTGTFDGVTSLSQDYIHNDNLKNSRTGGMAFIAIPEPATLGLVATVGVALLFVRRHFMI